MLQGRSVLRTAEQPVGMATLRAGGWYLGFTKLEHMWLGIQVWLYNSYLGNFLAALRDGSLLCTDLPVRRHFPDPIRACPAHPAPALPVVCFRRACPFLMAWSTFFFLFTISSFRAWTERQTAVNLSHGHLCVLLASTRQMLREQQEPLAQQGWTTDLTPVQSTSSCCGTYWAFWDQP